MLSLPNQITLLRMAMIPAFMFFLLVPVPGAQIIALILFSVAALSDAIDGYVARNWEKESDFGKFADPIADKLLITAALLAFIERGELSSVPVMIILAREFLVTGLRIWAAAQGRVIHASALGKLKTLSHIGLVFVVLTNDYWAWLPRDAQIKLGFTWLAVFLALLSGADYFYKGRALFKGL